MKIKSTEPFFLLFTQEKKFDPVISLLSNTFRVVALASCHGTCTGSVFLCGLVSYINLVPKFLSFFQVAHHIHEWKAGKLQTYFRKDTGCLNHSMWMMNCKLCNGNLSILIELENTICLRELGLV